ncbi:MULTISPECIES: phage regulatory protein/antirepressor Ant [unclassified Pseudomonas]|uniref:phage antirepressor KilAC domain-containing protein n=1 Tax=unclassified Pseudomonas TaxID=196821 RepID=UPI000D392F33|nr:MULTISPECIES: phage regulatory protein/antirepressor Ant [unclassified Pseudomonas]RAU43531.1 DNA-binding protein [Pseudomonas sp. RIT 409]RAU50006.1 DNA-binding protein [Pseudomonas sp. RIT 412]
MSSRLIAELTGKQHFHVKRDIEKLLADLNEDTSKFGCIYLDGKNRKQTEYLLDREHTDCLLTGYSAPLRMAVVRRWRELEEQAAPRIPANFAEALQLAADQVRENGRLLGLIELQAPKVAAIKRLAAAEGAICISDAAKQLGMAPYKLFDWMQQNRWIFRRGGSKRWIAMQPRIQSGYLKHKVTALTPDTETGADRAAFQPLVTPKGLTRLAEIFQEGK